MAYLKLKLVLVQCFFGLLLVVGTAPWLVWAFGNVLVAWLNRILGCIYCIFLVSGLVILSCGVFSFWVLMSNSNSNSVFILSQGSCNSFLAASFLSQLYSKSQHFFLNFILSHENSNSSSSVSVAAISCRTKASMRNNTQCMHYTPYGTCVRFV